jgi:hypothetical protein
MAPRQENKIDGLRRQTGSDNEPDVEEAIDEEGPGITGPLSEDAQSARGQDSLATPRRQS